MSAADPVRRRGRPAAAGKNTGEPAARDRILSSARSEFAERGYDKASVRAIARGAGVDPALVHHYFGTKEQVFAAAVLGAFAPAMGLPDLLLSGSREEWGAQLTAYVLGVWEDAATREPLLAIMRSAVNNETAASLFRDLVGRNVLQRVADGLGMPDAELRVELAIAQLVGTALLRYVIRLEPIASVPPGELVERLGPVVQHHLTG